MSLTKLNKTTSTLALALLLMVACSGAQAQDITRGLKDVYKAYFPIGVAVSPRALKDPQQAALITQQFNSLTPENAMKMGPIHPEENRYNWRDADSIVAFAQARGMKVRGHTLCWHQQTPAWLFVGEDGQQVSKTVLLQRLKAHIETVVGRYKGKIYAWDVVNEAVDDDDANYLRNSLWYKICGEDFIYKAFEYAHAADPQAVLFYNDYNTERPGKRERIFKLLKAMKDANVPVHAVGLQGHWSIADPSQKDLVATLDKFASLELKIQVTELDLSVYAGKEPQPLAALTPEVAEKQAQQYAMLFKVFRHYKNVLSGITFWNISDRSSWLDNFPIKGRKNYPLLFDQNLQPKKAYWQVVNF